MITIDDPPIVRACSACMSALSWLYSPRNHAWFAVVRVDGDTMRVHRCTTTGTPPSWRDTTRRTEPTPEYRATRQQLKTAPKETP